MLLVIGITTGLAASGYTLVVDAGHGGHDTGAKGASSLEKDINLKVALAFGQYVEQNCKDVNVIYTRKTDVFIPLKERANIANRNNADLFVSVHTNALPNGRIARGFEVYTLGMHRAKDNLDVAMRENSVIEEEDNYKQTYQGFDPKSSESYIMFEFMQSANMRRSVDLAKMIENSVCSTADRVNMGVHQAGFLVLRETSMPSCLIELGFITTPDEEEYLNTDEGVDKLAYGIYKAFVDYKNKYPGKSTTRTTTVSQQPATTAQNVEKQQEDNPSKEVESEKKAEISTKKTETLKNKEIVKRSEPTKKTEVVKKAEPTKKVEPVKKAEPTKKTETVKKAEVNKKVEPTKKNEATKKNEPTKKVKSEAGRPVFKVQIFAVGKKIEANDPLLKGHSDVDTYKDANSHLTKYTIGCSTDYDSIVKLRKSLIADFPQAYIVAFKDGKSVNLAQAINEYKKNKRK